MPARNEGAGRPRRKRRPRRNRGVRRNGRVVRAGDRVHIIFTVPPEAKGVRLTWVEPRGVSVQVTHEESAKTKIDRAAIEK